MPIVDGNYVQRTEDEIQTALEQELINEFGADIDLTESSTFSTLVEVLASVASNNQEATLEDVYESAFLDTATGVDLERVVSIIGLQRRSAVHATGIQRFIAPSPVTQTYTIQKGTTVQTGSDDPVEFETTDVANLLLIDDFSSGDVSNYSGDTVAASLISDADAVRGNNVLQLDATADAFIYDDSIDVSIGTKLHCHVRPSASTVPTVVFGVDPFDATNYYQIAVDESVGEVRLEVVKSGTTTTLDTLSTTLTAGSFHEIEFEWSTTNNIGVTAYDPSGNELGKLSAVDDTYLSGHVGFKSGDANGTKSFDFYTTSEVSANIRAKEGGVKGNVGPNSITVMPSPPNGVDESKNLYPTGDDSYKDINGDSLTLGLEEEADEELRNRASEAVTGGGSATHDAIVSELLNNTEGVTSVTLFENNTNTDNTGSGGLPPYSFEAVVFGGADSTVAETIFDKKAVTSRDYGGANGTKVTETVAADSNGQTREIEFSRPTKVTVSMSLDLVVDDTYIGDDNLRDKVVNYIGGVLSNGSDVIGLGVAENVRADRIKDVVVGDDTGVIGLDQSVDGTPLETTPSLTVIDGLEVIDIGANEVAQTDGTDATITLNTKEVTN
jgi:uncharacterized phage protein gp47/JayE